MRTAGDPPRPSDQRPNESGKPPDGADRGEGSSLDSPDRAGSARGDEHLTLLRDVLVFQVKLAADGLRDVLLSPVSIIAALAGVLMQRQGPPDRYFRALLRLGRRSDHWINLFGANSAQRGPVPSRPIDSAAIAITEELSQHLDRRATGRAREEARPAPPQPDGRAPPESGGAPGPDG